MNREHRFFAPGRLNIIGEHTDYSGGYVMPAPLSLGIYFENVQLSDQWDIRSLTTGEHFTGDPEGSWSGSPGLHRFIFALTTTLQDRGLVTRPLKGTLKADLPIGNGLSSSTALTSVLLLATSKLSRWSVPNKDMAFIGQSIERSMGINCGIMDQFCMWMGISENAMVLDCHSLQFRPVSIELPGYQWLLLLSGVKHHLLDSPYNERREQLFRGMDLLMKKGQPADFLKNSGSGVHQAILAMPEGEERSRVHYVWKENQRVLQMERALAEKDSPRVMRLLNEGHDGLAEEFQVSCSEIDQLVMLCRKAVPEIGIRMVGGGFGGSLLALVRRDLPAEVLQEIIREYQDLFPVNAAFLPVSLGGPVRELSGDSSFL